MGVQGRRSLPCCSSFSSSAQSQSLEAEHSQELWHRDAGSKKEPGTRCPWGTCLPSCQLKFRPHCREDKLVGGTQGCFVIAHAPL